MSITLGWQPIAIQPIFSRGQDWIVTFEPAPAAATPVWPTGAVVIAYVYPATGFPGYSSNAVDDWPVLAAWSGSITADRNYLTIKGSYLECDNIPGGSLMRIRVVLLDNPANDNYTWAAGTVIRSD